MIDRRVITDALIQALKDGTSLEVGDHKAPANTKTPYLIVYSVPGGGFDGPPLIGPDDDIDFVYQVTAVGSRRDQAEAAADRARHVILGREPDGRLKWLISGVSERNAEGGPGGVDPEISSTTELYSHAERYVLRTLS